MRERRSEREKATVREGGKEREGEGEREVLSSSLCLCSFSPLLCLLSAFNNLYAPSLSFFALSLFIKIICFSDRNIFYILIIEVGSIPQQNLHNISFSVESCKV